MINNQPPRPGNEPCKIQKIIIPATPPSKGGETNMLSFCYLNPSGINLKGFFEDDHCLLQIICFEYISNADFILA